MIARFDHRPMLTAVLALSTTVLVVVVITLATLLIRSAPQAASASASGGDGANTGAVVLGTGKNYGEGWNNYGHDIDRPRFTKTVNGDDYAIVHHAEVVRRLGHGSLR